MTVVERDSYESHALGVLIAKDEIRDVLCRYCRGIDRKDFELVQSCYHEGATEDRGDYRGDAEGFVEFARTSVARFEHTMHLLGNMLIEVSGMTATAETYALAIHRLPVRPGKLKRDLTIMVRYVDVFEKRAGRWAIASRVVAHDWARLDSDLDGREMLADAMNRGRPAPDDIVYARLAG